MDELALRNLLNSLEASRSSLHILLHGFTWAVVVGLGFDLIVIIKEFSEGWKEFRYGQVHPYEIHLPKRPSVGLVALGLLGTALIVIGVAGELYVDVQAGKIETQIKAANNNLLGLIIQEAGDAAASAKTAHAETNAVQTEARAIKLQLDAVAKRAEALGFQLDFRGPRVELFTGTNVSRPGLGKFMEKVKPFSGQKVEIRTNLSGIPDLENRQEAKLLATELDFLLGQVSGWMASMGEGGHNWGVEVVVNRKAPRETREAASALASGLGDVGLTGMQRQKPEVVEAQVGSETDRTNFAPDTILLFVGRHP